MSTQALAGRRGGALRLAQTREDPRAAAKSVAEADSEALERRGAMA